MANIIQHASPRQKKASKNLALTARTATRNGTRLIDFLCRVYQNEDEQMSDRLHAAQILFERGWGNAPIQVHVEIEETATHSRFSLEQLLSMQQSMNQLEAGIEVIEGEVLEKEEVSDGTL